MVVEIKALACERPVDLGLPLARLSSAEIARVAIARDIVEAISVTTVWRWLSEDALRPWTYRSWIFPRDPAFESKAGRVIDLYGGRWQGEPLRSDEHVVCADEKTSIQARARIHPGTPPAPGRAGRVEHEYERRGALAYLAAWDVHRAQVFGRCEPRTGIAPFGRLVEQVMSQVIVGLIRSAASDPRAAAMLREILLRQGLPDMARALQRSDPELRAELVGAHLVGLAMARFIIGIEPLASADRETLAAAIGPTFQRYLTGDIGPD